MHSIKRPHLSDPEALNDNGETSVTNDHETIDDGIDYEIIAIESRRPWNPVSEKT
ncbi:hypothetical protein Bhyg_03319, partial [Pseudolycoriella hygida]